MTAGTLHNPMFVAYDGTSMRPTLREPELLEVAPCRAGSFHVGDVVFFLQPASGQPIVHRVIRVSAAGLVTRGDDNVLADPTLLQPADIRGLVVAAWRGTSRRPIARGFHGRLAGQLLRARRCLDRAISPLLRPAYRALCSRGVIARLLPASLRPKVVLFRARGGDQLQLLLGRRRVGHFDDRSQEWRILRPYRVFLAGGSPQRGSPRSGPERSRRRSPSPGLTP